MALPEWPENDVAWSEDPDVPVQYLFQVEQGRVTVLLPRALVNERPDLYEQLRATIRGYVPTGQ